ncbi:unnamed protein product [Phytophthora fragariaefolia]|uniref:Unnamed protein product n=1 Tax=Phytophthora fragariaefolia TaxID=1490495 RepID=A0A9W7CXF1_9STRA|nr:unnamed protein product [Phytophthora fragariaefolia]
MGEAGKVVYEAAAAGALEILQHFREHGTSVSGDEEEDGETGEWDEEQEDWERGRWVLWGGLDAAEAAQAGHTDVVKWILETTTFDGRTDTPTIEAAMMMGNMELATWLMNHLGMDPEGYAALLGAAANGHVESLQWFQDRGLYTLWDEGVLIKAAEAGQLSVVRWILDRDRNDGDLGNESDPEEYHSGYRYEKRRRQTYLTCLGGEARLAIHAAAINGHLDVAKYIYAHVDIPQCAGDKLREKIKLFERCRSLRERLGSEHNAAQVSGKTMLRAAEKGFLDVVQWLFDEYNADPKVNLFWVKGVFDIEDGYCESDYSDDARSCCSVVDVAAANGHLEIVQYLLQVGSSEYAHFHKRQRTRRYSRNLTSDTLHCDDLDERADAACTASAMDGAAAGGHLNVVRWLHENRPEGCTTAAMNMAAANGHLEMVVWLHNNRSEGCTTDAIDAAARGGHLDVIKWLHAHRSEGCTTMAMNNAAATGSLAVLKWLHENCSEGCTAAAMDGAAAYAHLDTVKWLHRNRSEGCSERAMNSAAHNGNLQVLRWLFENRTEGFTAQAMDNATRFGHFEAVLVLHGLVQQGLAREMDIMDDQASQEWIAERYSEIMESLTAVSKFW